MSDSDDAVSRDAIFNGKITIRQRVKGYRFSIDALLLAWFVSALPGYRALELGTGSGVISLALAFKRPELRIDAVEVQDGLARLASENVTRNGIQSIKVTTADLRELRGSEWEGRYNFVFSNPPFRPVGRGRLNPNVEKALARHEIHSTLFDVILCGARCLQSQGYIGLILLAERIVELENIAKQLDLIIIKKCLVRPYPDRTPNLIMALIQEKGCDVLPDSEICVWERKGVYTPIVNAILRGDWEEIPHSLMEL